HKENGGVSAARRDGVAAAAGEYIVCVDGDDWLDAACLEKIAAAIDESGADIVCHGLVRDDGTALYPEPMPERAGVYSRADMEREIFPHLIQSESVEYFLPALVCKAIRRELFWENIFVHPLAKIGEDGACVISCVYAAQAMYVLKDCLYYYRYNAASATKSKKVFNWDWPVLVAEHIEKSVDMAWGDFRAQLDRKLAHDAFSVAVTQFYRKEPYGSIAADIREQLAREPYAGAIRRCRFRGSRKAALMSFCLKRRKLFPVWLYAKLR
ncbi:MAG: glycosyltransferase family 2 protein, partial [Oscillospiraceae bacterium]|nr:glycosyltransferase family 2 protein [Oscillospiraceae bacterium]